MTCFTVLALLVGRGANLHHKKEHTSQQFRSSSSKVGQQVAMANVWQSPTAQWTTARTED